jgi:hypothetical protein
MLSFRYVLVLERGERHQVLRHSSFQPLRVGEHVRTAAHGEWLVTEIVASDDATFRDGVAHCVPAPPSRERRAGRDDRMSTA